MKLVSKLEPIKSESTQLMPKTISIDSKQIIIEQLKMIEQSQIEFDRTLSIKTSEVYKFKDKMNSELNRQYNLLIKNIDRSNHEDQRLFRTKRNNQTKALILIESNLISQLNEFSPIPINFDFIRNRIEEDYSEISIDRVQNWVKNLLNELSDKNEEYKTSIEKLKLANLIEKIKVKSKLVKKILNKKIQEN
jgi:hypothetical protein